MKLLLTSAVALAMATPTLAGSHMDLETATCADYLAMSDEDKAMTVEAVHDLLRDPETEATDADAEVDVAMVMDVYAAACEGNDTLKLVDIETDA